MAVCLALVGVLAPVSFTMATGRSSEVAVCVFVVCQFVTLSTILIGFLTYHRISLIKVALGLAIEGVLALVAILVGGGADPYNQSGPVAWFVFAIFESVALAFVVIVLARVSRAASASRASKAAGVTLQWIFGFAGLIAGGLCGILLLVSVFKLGLGGFFIGMYFGLPGAVAGWWLGGWIGSD